MAEAPHAETDSAAPVLLVWLGGQCCAVAADRVIRVLAAAPLMRLPFLPACFSGVAALGGKVVPVLNRGRLLALPEKEEGRGEWLLVAIRGDHYALCVDRVGQLGRSMTLDEIRLREASVIELDLDALLAASLDDVAPAFSPLTGVATATMAAAAKPAPVAARMASLVVKSADAEERLPLGWVIEICETLAVAAIPEPRPHFAGAAFYRDELLPVIPLHALRGRPEPENTRSGAYVIIDVEGRRCALSVAQVIGMAPQAPEDQDLRPLIQALLPPPLVSPPGPAAAKADAQRAPRYLLAELSGRICGFDLSAVVHIHPASRLACVPGGVGWGMIGVAAIGGRVLPVLDLAPPLGLRPQNALAHFIEIKTAGARASCAIAVQRILGIAGFAQEDLLAPPPGSLLGAIARQTGEGNKELIWIIDIDAVIGREERCNAG